MSSHLFQALPIGALFFREPFNPNENPSFKSDATHARKPNGDVVEVNGGVLVFTGIASPTVITEQTYIAVVVEREPVQVDA